MTLLCSVYLGMLGSTQWGAPWQVCAAAAAAAATEELMLLVVLVVQSNGHAGGCLLKWGWFQVHTRTEQWCEVGGLLDSCWGAAELQV